MYKGTFFDRVSLDFETGCWNWKRGKSSDGYGSVGFRGKTEGAHRVSAILFLGFDPASRLHVLHTCDNPACVNPKHLYFGTHQDNMRDLTVRRRGVNAKKTHCINGHPYTSGNTYYSSGGRRRSCRLCHRNNYLEKTGRPPEMFQ
jgi:HNH endonuclease